MQLIKALEDAGYKGIYIIEVGGPDGYTATSIHKDDSLYVACQLALEEARADIAWAEATSLEDN